ncbi:unnamed protein product [Cuscuta epithymum]|uniref:Uncharacterized protein n=2 Tax=Cuscuta epithymum TaxID=186058 RepID=A0AAV0CGB4_9ASTE|nr:unnamed protein product [Cuscuta epithymum]
MGFIVFVFIGAAMGIGLVACFARAQNTRSENRIELAKVIAAFSRMTIEDLRKLFSNQTYPSWIVLAQRQKLEWLNRNLEKLWPYINEASAGVIRTKVEPTLQEHRSRLIADLKFSKLTLGTVAPKFTGVSIIDSDPNEIIMEMEVQWDGNPRIVLDISTKVGVSIPIEVKDISFTGVFRIIFKPLVEEFPCFGALSYSLRKKEKLNFRLKVGGNISSTIPGLLDALKSTILDSIEDSITWPVRQIIPIVPGDYSDLELKTVGILKVKLIQGKELTNKDFIGKSDPFAEVFIRPQRHKIKTSKVINNSVNPIWNENFEFEVEDASTQHLTVMVYDDEGIQNSEFIGCAQTQLKDIEPGEVKSIWLKLVKDLEIQRDTKNRGQIQLELLYCPNGTESTIYKSYSNPGLRLTDLEKALLPNTTTHNTDDSLQFRGVLRLTVIKAEDLPATGRLQRCDPYVLIKLKKSEHEEKTRVATKTLNPVWDQTFNFVIEDGLHDLLICEVWDNHTCRKQKVGRCITTLTKVLLKTELTDCFELDGAVTGKLHLTLKWTPQPIIL